MYKLKLLPHRYKRLGAIVLIVFSIVGFIALEEEWTVSWLTGKFFVINSLTNDKTISLGVVNFTQTICGVLVILGGLLVAFSKEKEEDEYIEGLRLNALLWAVLVNYSLLILAFIFIYDLAFLDVMVYNMFTVLIIFIVRFNYTLYKFKRTQA
jgi:hypothetical protein